MEINDINEQYLSEFLEALQTSINQLSADGVRISYVPSKGRELSKYMAQTLDEDWNQMRGMEIQSVGIASISYDEESTKLINMLQSGRPCWETRPSGRAMCRAPMARGLEAAGSNANGAMAGFMGMGVGMQAGGNMMGNASQVNLAQMQMQQQAAANQAAAQQAGAAAAQTPGNAAGWTCECGAVNSGKFCGECGKPQPAANTWICECGNVNTGKFCSECGKPAPAADWTCECGAVNSGKFCGNCGKARP